MELLSNLAHVGFILLEVILLFNAIIIVHELGHFWAARWRGLVVEKFGIWFGKPIWKKEYNGVEYSLGCIPAGGFVALPQLAPMESLEGESKLDKKNLPPVKPLDKIIVAFAGPLASILLAVFFATIIWVIGRPVSESESTTKVGFVAEGSPAEKAGIKTGDIILEVDNHKVNRFAGMGEMTESINWNVIRSESPTIPVKLKRGSEIITLEVSPKAPEREGWKRQELKQIGIGPSQTPVIAQVIPNSPAQKAGLRSSDIVSKINNKPMHNLQEVSELMKSIDPSEPINLEILRGQETVNVTVTREILKDSPEKENTPRIGILWDDRGITNLSYPNPLEQISASIKTMIATLEAVFSPKSDVKAEHLSGPVGIMRVYYLLFQSPDGWRLAIWFSVILNVNLAILNLLPIPILDGGHITIATVEAIRKRPIRAKTIEILQTGFAFLLIGYMLYITFFDIQDLTLW
jgi:regulator of sigma E protease